MHRRSRFDHPGNTKSAGFSLRHCDKPGCSLSRLNTCGGGGFHMGDEHSSFCQVCMLCAISLISALHGSTILSVMPRTFEDLAALPVT